MIQTRTEKLKIAFNPRILERQSKEDVIALITDERLVSYMTLSRKEATNKLSDNELVGAVERIMIRQENGYLSPSCIFENQDAQKRLPEEVLTKLKEIPKPEPLKPKELKSRYQFPRKQTLAEIAWHLMGSGNAILLDLMNLLIQDKITDIEALKIAKKVEQYREVKG